MAMSGNGKAQINVTPMIDVLLVLLIIFMVISPEHQVGLDAHIPLPAPSGAVPQPHRDITLTVHGSGDFDLDSGLTAEVEHQSIAATDIESRLADLYRTAGNRPLFVRADSGSAETLDFQTVAHVIDVARGAGLNRVGLLRSSR